MKYTRYDLNKRQTNGGKIMVFLVIVVVVALTLGTALAKFIFNKTTPETGSAKSNDTKQIGSVNKDQSTTFTMVQCGFYSKKENADENVNKLKDKYNAFTIKDNDKYRVITFIGTADDANKIVKQLTEEAVTNLKINFEIDKKDLCSQELSEMISGYLKIIHTLEGKDTKSIKTDEFKKWTNGLQEDTKSELYPVFQNIKKNINDLPQEIGKDNISSSYDMIFQTLNNFKKK